MDDADPSVPPDATAPDAPPVVKAAPPTSRAIAMFAIVFVFFGLLAAAAWFIGGPTEGCKLDARVGPNQEAFGRDPRQDCKFVDADGNVLPGQ